MRAKQEAIDILWFSRPRRQTKNGSSKRGIGAACNVLLMVGASNHRVPINLLQKKGDFVQVSETPKRPWTNPDHQQANIGALTLAGLKSDFDVCSKGNALMVVLGVFCFHFFSPNLNPPGLWMRTVNLGGTPQLFAFS